MVEAGRQLTPEFAKHVDLSVNPFRRHEQVGGILSDEGLRADGFNILVNPGHHIASRGGEKTLVVHSVWPLLGRHVLERVADTIVATDSM